MINKKPSFLQRLFRILRGAVLGIVAFVVFLSVGLFFAQQRIFYPIPSNYAQSLPMGLEQVSAATADGLQLTAAYRPAQEGLPTVVFFHGNADSLASAAFATQMLAMQGYGLYLVEYRGYGGNGGSPHEAGLYHDGEAALAWLADKGVAAEDIVLMGHSLGGGPATEMALRHKVRGLVLLATFSSLPDVVHDRYGWIPLHLLVRDHYDSKAKLPQITAPILLVHGTADRVVGAENTERLAAAQPNATVRMIEGVGHGVLNLAHVQAAVTDWIAALPSDSAPSAPSEASDAPRDAASDTPSE